MPTALMFGDGTPARVTLGSGEPVFGAGYTPTPELGQTVIATTGASFAPRVELAAGSTAQVVWQDNAGVQLATGVAPTISFDGAETRQVRLWCSHPGDVRSLNLGFDHTQDAGRDGPGAAYDRAAQQISGITGLGVLTGLRQFMAANTALTGHLDLTGLSQLLYVECFNADLTSVALTGCTALNRLCLESNRISSLDLNPVAGNLYDLRAAEQWEGIPGHALDFVPLTQAMPHLWHYCVRDQTVTRMVPLSLLPAMEQYWIWNTDQTQAVAPTSAVLNSLIADNNHYEAAAVNAILGGLDAHVLGGGYCTLAGSAAPTGAGATARANLISRGWTVVTS